MNDQHKYKLSITGTVRLILEMTPIKENGSQSCTAFIPQKELTQQNHILTT